MMELNTERIVAEVPQKEIVYVDMIFKSFEGIAVLTVSKKKNGKPGEIYLDVTKGTKKLVLHILKDLKSEFPVKIIKA